MSFHFITRQNRQTRLPANVTGTVVDRNYKHPATVNKATDAPMKACSNNIDISRGKKRIVCCEVGRNNFNPMC